jgi:FdrA protein
MPLGFRILKNQYFDSVFLMGVNKHLSDEKGVQQTAVLMGSDGNKKLLKDLKLYDPGMESTLANDLIVSIQADTEAIASDILSRLPEFLKGGAESKGGTRLSTLENGLTIKPDANLAVISIPGEFAAREAKKALDHGMNVFLFSDNVNLEDELMLKSFAHEQGLLVMGPDCGTSLIGGKGIGFANVVRKGSIGAIGPSGTGLQEFTSQVHNAGYGISHAIGTGSHDLSDTIGGLTTFSALDALESDSSTKVIAIISKPPGVKTIAKLMERIKNCPKPIIGCFLGVQSIPPTGCSRFSHAITIDEAVRLSIVHIGGKEPLDTVKDRFFTQKVDGEKKGFSPGQRYLRGIFAGGTFCYQTQQILRANGIGVYSNAPLEKKMLIDHPTHSLEHCVVDMGDDYFTQGKPHPMIDGTERRKRILEEARDPELKVLLLDFILGYNASMDPAGELADAIAEAKKIVASHNGYLSIVASICGTENDPQDLKLQEKILEELGVIVFRSNAKASQFCVELIK